MNNFLEKMKYLNLTSLPRGMYKAEEINLQIFHFGRLLNRNQCRKKIMQQCPLSAEGWPGRCVKLLLNASLKVFLEPAAWHVMPGQRRPSMTCQAAGSRKTFNEAFKRSLKLVLHV